MKFPSIRRKPAFEYGEILPEAVRTALSYNEAKLTRCHIERGLLAHDRFKNLGFYLLMKATDAEDYLQTSLLNLISGMDFRFADLDRSEIPVLSALDHLDSQPQPFVQGGKLAQISRHGSENWLNNFDKALKPKMDDPNPPKLFAVANSVYVGLSKVASLSVMRGEPLRILKPSRFDNPDEPVGFTLSPDGDSIKTTPLERDFERPENAIVFDDVTSHGTVKSQVMEFWGDARPPDFTAAVATAKT